MDNFCRTIYIWTLLIIALTTGVVSQAQDSLRMKTGAVYSVKVVEITETNIKYRTYSNPDGPLYNVLKTTVETYKLEGRTWEYFYEAPEEKRKSQRNSEDRNHYMALNLSDLLRTDLTIFYEWIFADKIGLRVPVTYGFRSAYLNPTPTLLNPFAFKRNTVFKTGVDLRIYAGEGLRRARFVFGPSVNYLRLNRVAPDYVTSDPSAMIYKQSNAVRILFYVGLIIRPNDFILFGIDGGMGGDIDLGEKAGAAYTMGVPVVQKAQLNVHLGYRF